MEMYSIQMTLSSRRQSKYITIRTSYLQYSKSQRVSIFPATKPVSCCLRVDFSLGLLVCLLLVAQMLHRKERCGRFFVLLIHHASDNCR